MRAPEREKLQNPISASAPQNGRLLRLVRQRQVEALHRLGPRVVGELLDEISRHHRLDDDIARRLARYAALDPGVLRALNADRFPPAPLWGVSRVAR
jgi:hypothetical protein